jgi:hypothetical protein
MAEPEAVPFDQALEDLARALSQEQPTARRALDGPRVRPGQLPDIGPLPRHEVRSAQPQMPSVVSSPLDYFPELAVVDVPDVLRAALQALHLIHQPGKSRSLNGVGT